MATCFGHLTLIPMERYRHLVGKHIEAHYRSGDFYLSCVGTLTSDDDHVVVVHERFSCGESQKTMRVEIPYSCIVRMTKASTEPSHVLPGPMLGRSKRR